jgi:hypothetical protein
MSKKIPKKGPFRNDRGLVLENKINPGQGHTREQEEEKNRSRVCDAELQYLDEQEEIDG